jgi:hypothetical protein
MAVGLILTGALLLMASSHLPYTETNFTQKLISEGAFSAMLNSTA